MQHLAYRSDERELMDMENIPFEEFHDCLRQLEVINHLTLAYRPVLGWLRKLIKPGEPLCILDAGCGGGDTLRQIEKKFCSRYPIELIGVDLNPWAKKSANTVTEKSRIRYETADIFSFEPGKKIDVIIASLFTHHLPDEQIIEFLRWANEHATQGWLINDLHRHSLPYYFIKFATRIFSRNRLIRNDAAVSVARSFTRTDWNRLLQSAGLKGVAKIEWYFPFRFCVSCVKTAAIQKGDGKNYA